MHLRTELIQSARERLEYPLRARDKNEKNEEKLGDSHRQHGRFRKCRSLTRQGGKKSRVAVIA